MQVIDSRKITDSMARTASNDMAANLDKAQEKRLIAEINHYRHEQGLPKLKVNRKLEAAAAKHSKNMATMNFFSHTDNQGLTPFDRIEKAGYPVKSSYTGENLAAGQMYSTDVLDQWLASKLHRAVLNNPNYTAIGIKRACNVDTTYGCYWTANFGSKRKG